LLLPLSDDAPRNQQSHNHQNNKDDKCRFIGEEVGHHDIRILES